MSFNQVGVLDFYYCCFVLHRHHHKHLHSYIYFTYLSSHGVINISISIVSRQLLIFILTPLLSLHFIIRITQSSVWLTVTSNFHTNACVSHSNNYWNDMNSRQLRTIYSYFLPFIVCTVSVFFITEKINYYDNISFSHK